MAVVVDGFEELFEHEYPRLVRVLRGADDDAADAVQEAFVQAFVRWRRVSALEDPAGWIRRVAVNRLLNARRSRVRRDRAVATLSEAHAEAPEALDTDSHLDLRAAVRRLAPQQRIAVALFYGGDYSVSQVADAMRLSEGTVKYHLHAGRERLRDLLTEAPHG